MVAEVSTATRRLRQELCKRDQAAILSTGASMATPSLYLTPR